MGRFIGITLALAASVGSIVTWWACRKLKEKEPALGPEVAHGAADGLRRWSREDEGQEVSNGEVWPR